MNERTKKAERVTVIGFIINAALTAAKFFAGIFGNSAAMVADAVHSLSDFITDLIVLFFIRFSGKDCDEEHPYGHGKFETFATLLISGVLFLVGLGMMWNGCEKIKLAYEGTPPSTPGIIALIVAIFSIVSKEILYQYTVKVGKEINNAAVIANAWHHRSDALSSIGTLIGISGAIILGGDWAVLDPIAAVIVSVLILRVAVQLGLPSVNELLEKALPKDVEQEILDLIYLSPEIKDTHRLRTRKIGNIYAIDIHIKLDPSISFVASHDVATEVENRLRCKYGKKTLINIHTEPYDPSKNKKGKKGKK